MGLLCLYKGRITCREKTFRLKKNARETNCVAIDDDIARRKRKACFIKLLNQKVLFPTFFS